MEQLKSGERNKKRRLEQTKYNAEDALDSLLKNPNIPDSIKHKLKEEVSK